MAATATQVSRCVGEYTSALQIVSDYISDALAKQLKIRLEGVFAEAVAESCTGKRKADWELALEMERETQALHVAPVLAKPQAVVKVWRFSPCARCADAVHCRRASPRSPRPAESRASPTSSARSSLGNQPSCAFLHFSRLYAGKTKPRLLWPRMCVGAGLQPHINYLYMLS